MGKTVKDVEKWLDEKKGKKVVFPTDLPSDLEGLGKMDLLDLKSWFDFKKSYAELPDVSCEPKNLRMTSKPTVGNTPVDVTVRFLVRGATPKKTDPVEGVRFTVAFDVKSTPLSFLDAIGLKRIELSYEAWWIDGIFSTFAEIRGEVSYQNSKTLILGCQISPGAPKAYYDFSVTPSSGSLALVDVLKALQVTKDNDPFSGLPDVLPAITSITLRYFPGLGKNKETCIAVFIDAAIAHEAFSWAVVLLPAKQGKRPLILSGDLPVVSSQSLSDIDLLRGHIPAEYDLSLDVQLAHSSQKLTPADVALFNAICSGHSPAPPPLPVKTTFAAGFHVVAWVTVGDRVWPVVLRTPKEKTGHALEERKGHLQETGGAPGEGHFVLPIRCALGPLHVEQVAVAFRAGRGKTPSAVTVTVEAAFLASGFALDASGLGLQVELTKNTKVTATLNGLGISYGKDPVHVAGALISSRGGEYDFRYDGLVMVRATKFGLMAVGSYAKLKNPPFTSLFVFGALQGKISGPPPVDFTGLVLGFGYNSKVTLPAIDQVADFPFVKAIGQVDQIAGNPPKAAKALERFSSGKNPGVRPESGSFWIAAGLSIAVAETFKAKALVVVEFGNDFTIAVLGGMSAEFPTRRDPKDKTPRLAHIELVFRALYEHAKHQLSLEAALTDSSWIIAPACKLTGGAALHLWFPGSTHAGDFVATIGGYHPSYKKPDHYPTVPRLGLHWSYSRYINITGELYAALTPSVGMVGGRLALSYDDGDLRASLTAAFNAMVWWAPLYFEADLRISIWASYTANLWVTSKTFRGHVDATLHLWGPPVGGSATVKVAGLFSKTVEFGSGRDLRKDPMQWKDFRAKQLPEAPLGISALDGLLTDPAKAERVKDGTWVVSVDGFSFLTRTAVPATKISRKGSAVPAAQHKTGVSLPAGAQGQLSVRPMDKKDKQATHTITIDSVKKTTVAWTWQAQAAAFPQALWGKPQNKPEASDQTPTLAYANGVQVIVPPPTLQSSTPTYSTLSPDLDKVRFESTAHQANPFTVTTSSTPDGTKPGLDDTTIRANLRRTMIDLGVLEAAP